MASYLLFNYDYDYAEAYSKASLDRANQLYLQYGENVNNDFKVCIALACYTMLKVYTNTGRLNDGRKAYENFTKQYSTLIDNKAFDDVKLEASEMYLATFSIETARKIIFSLSKAEMAAPRLLRYNQIKSKIAQFTVQVTDLPKDLIDKQTETEDEDRQDIVNSLNYFMQELTGLTVAIEASKGRNLADNILAQTGKEAVSVTTENLFARLIQIFKQHSFHYLSIFVDEDWSYSILVTAEGK